MKRILFIILILTSLQGFSQTGFYGYLTNNTWRGMGATQKAHLPADTFNVTGNLKNYKWIALKSGSIWLWNQSLNRWVQYSSGGSSNTYALPLLNTSDVISIKGLNTNGLNGQVPISNGTQWGYHYPFNSDSANARGLETKGRIYVIDGGDDLDTLAIDGTVITAYAQKTSAYTITNDDHTIHCTSGTFTVMLPAANAANVGQEFLIKNTGAGTITVDGNGSETIDAGTTYPLAQYKFILIKSTGAGVYLIIGNN